MITANEEEDDNNMTAPTTSGTRVVLIACGSFNPPTPMHLRMFEIAKDYFEMLGTYNVIGGIVSPTHDSYKKKDLAPARHRCGMVKLALQTSDWIRLSEWESSQNQWSRTKQVLQHHQNYMNNYINSPIEDNFLPGWLPPGLRFRKDRVHLKLLCGADLLESFAVPGLWASEDIEDILSNHGIVVISRSGANPERFIFESDLLTKYQKNITLVTNWVPNEVSSTMIRRLLGRAQSAKYLIDELVLEYIKIHGLYGAKSKYITKTQPRSISNQNLFNATYINQPEVDSSPSPLSSNFEDTMDETDNSIKNCLLTSINLDNGQPRVFCCGNDNSEKNKGEMKPQQHGRKTPGQAVQVITSSPGRQRALEISQTEVTVKKLKMSPEYV